MYSVLLLSRNKTPKSVKTPVKSSPIDKIKAILAKIRIIVAGFCLDHFDNYLETINRHKFIKIVWSCNALSTTKTLRNFGKPI